MTVVIEKPVSTSQALEHMEETLIDFGVQGPPNPSADADSVEYIHDAVNGLYWAHVAILQCAATEPLWINQKFYTTLVAA